jgi:hypothetical protein
MNSQDWRHLVNEYIDWLKRGLTLSQVDDSCEILTPFLDRHNDTIAIYAEMVGPQIRLSDDAYTISDLRSSGMEFSTDKRRAYLLSILNGFGVKLEGDELAVVATPATFPQKKHNLLQAILAVNDMVVMAEEHVVSFFKEDVALFLESVDVPFISDIKLAGKTGLDHRFDFGLPRRASHPERVIRAMNILDKHNATDFAFAVSDIRVLRPDQLGAIAFINDLHKSPSEDNLNALRAYEIATVAWSRREEAVEQLLNGV